jgi:tetratricopeptide (TPR) repeat protein
MPRAFVIRPFNKKTAVNDRSIDFEQIHSALIGPALTANGLDGTTTGEIVEPGNIREDMFSLIVEADLVVCDITIHNANVFYELGIRHALRKKRTVLIKGSPTADPTPFDILTDRYVAYPIDDAAAALPALSRTIKAALDSERETDSPIFKMLPGLVETDPTTVIALPLGLREEVERATRAGSKGWLRLLAHEVRGQRFERVALQLIGDDLWRVGDYEAAREALELIRALVPDDRQANLSLANIYERLYRRQRKSEQLTLSDQAVERALANKGNDRRARAEALALKGRNSKTLWREEFEQEPELDGRRAAARSLLLRRSYDAYREAFQEDLNHFWPGLAALQMGVTFLELAKDDGWTSSFDRDEEAHAYRSRIETEIAALKLVVPSSITATLARPGTSAEDRMWAGISQADVVFLIEANEQRVVRRYLDAVPKDNTFAADAAIGQLTLFEALGIHASTARAVIDTLTARAKSAGAAPGAAAGPAKAKDQHVVLFTGHRFDAADRPTPRFPATLERSAFDAIRSKLAELNDSYDIVGIASAAPGGDLLFHDACRELGVPSTVCLPMNADDYLTAAVSDLALRRRIVALFDEKMALRPPGLLELSDVAGLPRWLDAANTNEWERSNRWELEIAVTLGAPHVTLLALWDEQPTGDGPGGTSHMVSLARGRAGVDISVIPTQSLAP